MQETTIHVEVVSDMKEAWDPIKNTCDTDSHTV